MKLKIQAKLLNKSYRGRKVVNNVSFEVEKVKLWAY